MNKTRIQEISQQVDIWCDQHYHSSEFYHLHWEEKFAQLLIEECIEVVRPFIHPGNEITAVKQHVKEHFYGVE